jgi:hypothetical protein
MRLDLTDEEATALLSLLNRAIDDDRYPLSPRIRTLRGIRAKVSSGTARTATGSVPSTSPNPERPRERRPGRARHSPQCSARGADVPHFPRFRALALFRRRPPERPEGSSLPASENPHRTGHSTDAGLMAQNGRGQGARRNHLSTNYEPAKPI